MLLFQTCLFVEINMVSFIHDWLRLAELDVQVVRDTEASNVSELHRGLEEAVLHPRA